MPPPRNDLHGERLSSLEAKVEALDKYEHDRWHKLAQDLQPLVVLPERMAREMGKIQGTFDGRIATITREIERSITAAVEKAIEPVDAEVAKLKDKVEALETIQQTEAGAKGLASKMLQSPIISGFTGALLAAGAIAWAFLTGKVQP